MSFDSTTIDRIVAGVLEQLGTGGNRAPAIRESNVTTSQPVGVRVHDHVVTAGVLERFSGQSLVYIGQKAIVTPAAWDTAREHGIEIIRGSRQSSRPVSHEVAPQSSKSEQTTGNGLLLVVRHTDAVDQLYKNNQSHWTRELVGCPDDAASLAISELNRGAVPIAVILAEQTHRAACLANRNRRIKAVAINDTADIPKVRKQLRANVWCINPTGKSWFELHRLLNSLVSSS